MAVTMTAVRRRRLPPRRIRSAATVERGSVELLVISDPRAPSRFESVDFLRSPRLRQWIGRPFCHRVWNVRIRSWLPGLFLRPLQQRFGEQGPALVPAFPSVNDAIGPPVPAGIRRHRGAALLFCHRIGYLDWREPDGARGQSDQSKPVPHCRLRDYCAGAID